MNEHSRHIVLVVGDVTQTDEQPVTALLRAGFDAIAVESAAAALALLDAGAEPCVLVIDVDTPDLDGWELWEQVKRRKGAERPAAVLLSSNALFANRARSVGVAGFLTKPATHESLIEPVERHCPRRVVRIGDRLVSG
jgi:CheY-like chemotaxis protein